MTGDEASWVSSGSVWLTQTTQIGHHRGLVVAVGVTRRPEDAPAPDEFGVNAFVPNERGEDIDIVRVDTAHDGCHVDRLYLPVDHPNRRDYSRTFYSPEAVFEWLVTDSLWRRFLEEYETNHGVPRTAEDRLD